MKKNNVLIIFIIVLILNLLILTLNSINKEYVMFGTTTILEYKNGKLNKIKETTKINKKLNYKVFNVYNNKEFNKYYLTIKEGDTVPVYEIYGLDNEQVYLSNSLLAHTDGISLKVFSSSISKQIEEEDKMIFDKIFDKYNLEKKYSLYMRKIECDIDNDGFTETLYSIDNYAFSIDKIYCLIFLVDSNNEIIMIDKIIDRAENIYEVYHKNLNWIVDIDNDNQYEIVLSRKSGDDTPTYYEFYKYDNKSKEITEIK